MADSRRFDIMRVNGESIMWTEVIDLITPADADILSKFTYGTVVEIGTNTGSSAEAILKGQCGHLICVDTFCGTRGDQYTEIMSPEFAFSILQSRLAPYLGRFSVIQTHSRLAAEMLVDEIADVVFIDAAHDYRSVVEDIKRWWPKVKKTGLLMGHDFTVQSLSMDKEAFEKASLEETVDGHFPGVVRAVMECFEKFRIAKEGSTIWVACKEDAVPLWLKQPAAACCAS